MASREWIALQLKKARIPRKQSDIVEEIKKFGVPMSQFRLSQLENAKTDLRADELAAFAKVYGVEPSYFLNEPKDVSRDEIEEERTAIDFTIPPELLKGRSPDEVSDAVKAAEDEAIRILKAYKRLGEKGKGEE